MSESAPAAAAAQPARDPITVLAEQIYVQLAGGIYVSGTQGKPDPKALAKLCIQLAQAFDQGYKEVNAAAIEAERKRKNFNTDELDLGAISMKA